MHMDILFVTRKFLPMKGGMEKVAYELYRHLSEMTNVKLVKWSGSNKWLPFALPYLLLKSCWILLTNKIDVIYLQDGLLAPLGLILKLFKKPVVITIHGLDITYKNRFYQFLVPRCIRRLDKIICISHATKQECVSRGIPKEKITVISDGVSDEFYINEDKKILKCRLEKELNLELREKKILLSVGRLVERKGFHWFIGNVIPKLLKQRNDFVYLIAGDGVFRKVIKNAIKRNGLDKHVIMLGKVDDRILKLLYNASDIFVMPNIPVKGDMEGFGIVALEAASCGVPVIASGLEGLKDAIKNGKNGVLVEPYNTDRWVGVINRLLKNNEEREHFGKMARKFSLESYEWKKIAKKYLEELKGVFA